MRIVKQGGGQFIIIAALLVAIIMVSVSTIMYSAVTYYRHERWEEYLAIIDNVELGSRRVVEMSLANYTLNNCIDDTILRDNLDRWINDAKKAYAGFGVIVSYDGNELSDDDDWYKNESFSAANATITIDITSVGLRGYKFTAPAFLGMKILGISWDEEEKVLTIPLAIDKEGSTPVTDLEKGNFSILVDDELKDFTLIHYYSETYDSFIHEIQCSIEDQPSLVSVTARDTRGIKVIANSTVTPPAETMHVGDISMWYEKQGQQYTVYTKIPILDGNGQAVSDATVYLNITLPNGSVQSFSKKTGPDGTVTFDLKSKLVGLYTSTVTDVVKEGWIYDSTSNVETSESLTVS